MTVFFCWVKSKLYFCNLNMKTRMRHFYIFFVVLFLFSLSCCRRGAETAAVSEDVMLLEHVGYPQAIFHNGNYYFTFQSLGGDSVELLCTSRLEDLAQARRRTVWSAERDTMSHFWSPEIHRVGDKWYIYFEGDDGNTDNHHLFVMECADPDPMTGQFVLKGPIETQAEWNYGIHPSLLQMPTGELYLLWSGWPERRHETETQCIYIARMENPWTTSSNRVMISLPDHEWERQWINPDGHRSAYPIYVNENPEAFVSPDGQRVVVLYSASGIWTVYTAVGMLSAPVTANLLDPAVWVKRQEPLIEKDSATAPCAVNVWLVPSADGSRTDMLYEDKRIVDGNIIRDIRLRRDIKWTTSGEPILQ